MISIPYHPSSLSLLLWSVVREAVSGPRLARARACSVAALRATPTPAAAIFAQISRIHIHRDRHAADERVAEQRAVPVGTMAAATARCRRC